MTITELLAKYDIAIESTAPGQYQTTCPQCSPTRKKSKAKCLGVLIDDRGVCWNCGHCSWSGPSKDDGGGANGSRPPLTAYIYCDREGTPRFRKVRNLPGREPKFWIDYPDGRGGWESAKQRRTKKRPAVDTTLIYRADEVAQAIEQGKAIAVVEGEKDANSLWAIGIAATCNAHGASEPGKRPKWTKAHSEQLRGADLIVFNDNDAAGYEHAETTAKLSLGIAKRVRRLDLAEHWPGIPKGGDVSDWLAVGHTGTELAALIEQAPDYVEPQQEPPTAEAPVRILPPPSAPVLVARHFVEACCLHNGDPNALTLRYWCGSWWLWKTTHWIEAEHRTVRALLYDFTADALYLDDKGNPEPWSPNRYKIGDLLEALSSLIILSDDFEQPCWIDGRQTGPIVATTNGLLDIVAQELRPHSPLYFGQVSVPFAYDPDAPPPDKWLAFLDALWPQEAEAIEALGEWFGYVISGRLDLHKILLTVGPTRGGKGVIARIETALIGKRSVCGPTLNSLGGEFGLAPLLGKSLAIISDARFSAGKGAGVVVERLLSISGEDTLTVNRKYREQWSGKLPVRLHIVSNELPRLGDASAAIIGRIVLLPLTRSWLGKEDFELETKLHAELSGILNWALEGLRRLTIDNENRFTRVASADDAITMMRDLASPVGAFVREMCALGSDFEIETDTIYGAFKTWCEANEYPKSPKAHFGRDLRAACPSIRKSRPWGAGDKDKRPFVYRGIRLRKPDEDKEPELSL